VPPPPAELPKQPPSEDAHEQEAVAEEAEAEAEDVDDEPEWLREAELRLADTPPRPIAEAATPQNTPSFAVGLPARPAPPPRAPPSPTPPMTPPPPRVDSGSSISSASSTVESQHI